MLSRGLILVLWFFSSLSLAQKSISVNGNHLFSRGFSQLLIGTKLDYEVDFEPTRWNVLMLLCIPPSNHFDVAVQEGFAKRVSLIAVLGYRFFKVEKMNYAGI